ncbi:hypothetical protein D3C80_2184900 [compost metagenome]
MPKPWVKMLFKDVMSPTIMLIPVIMIRKPNRVLKVPSATFPVDFFCSISPSMAIKAIRIEA